MKSHPFIIISCLMILVKPIKSQSDTLIYIGDPMCSWCYGFTPELDAIKAAFPQSSFEMVMGGLRPDGTETMGDLKEFLWNHWIEVQQASGQKFNFSILNKHDIMYNTEPACRAIIVADKLKPGIKYSYFQAVQKSFYLENNHPGDIDVYTKIAANLGLDADAFYALFQNPQSKMDAYSDFDLAASMGVKGFPALIAKIDGKLYLVTNGYQKADKIIKLLKAKGME
ncbi:MAG: DsbA family protein [Saprospiraceae bacterium]|nr:DsbA family protein [Saprospiraceae bacterium]